MSAKAASGMRRAVGPRQTAATTGNPQSRIFYTDGHIERYNDQNLAFAVWLALPKGVRAAFRGAGDNRPVHPWDLVDV